jgi:hypothetical protein
MFTDAVVKQHTKMMLSDILDTLDPEFNGIFQSGQTGLAFLVSRPLMLAKLLLLMTILSVKDEGMKKNWMKQKSN